MKSRCDIAIGSELQGRDLRTERSSESPQRDFMHERVSVRHYSAPVDRFTFLAAGFCFVADFVTTAAIAAIFFAVRSFFSAIVDVASATDVFRAVDFFVSAFVLVSVFAPDFLEFEDVAGLTTLTSGTRFFADFFCLMEFLLLPVRSTIV